MKKDPAEHLQFAAERLQNVCVQNVYRTSAERMCAERLCHRTSAERL